MRLRMLSLVCVASLAEASPPIADLELDPTPFVFGGYSLHAGIAAGRLRLDLGAYAMQLPRFIDDQPGFRTAVHGAGLKLQYAVYAGSFAGVDANATTAQIRRTGTSLAASATTYSVGLHAGWRIGIVDRFYVAPWISLRRVLNARDIELDGQTYRVERWTVLPAIHLGYRFR